MKKKDSRKIVVYLHAKLLTANDMAEKKYSLSLEQLNELVSDAVATAIKKLENVEIIDDDSVEKSARRRHRSL